MEGLKLKFNTFHAVKEKNQGKFHDKFLVFVSQGKCHGHFFNT